MKIHTTNYFDTFIAVAEDCPAKEGEIPPKKGEERTVANIQFEMLSQNPYRYTSDEVIFHCFAEKKSLPNSSLEAERLAFFAKGQACLRASALTKRYGWGVHADAEGKIAIYPLGSEEYKRLDQDAKLKRVCAMKNKR